MTNLSNLYPERNLQDFKRQFPHANKVFYQINPDDKNEYRTIYMHLNVFNSNLTPRYSNYIQGSPPPNLDPLTPHLLSSIMRYNSLQNQPFYWRTNALILKTGFEKHHKYLCDNETFIMHALK